MKIIRACYSPLLDMAQAISGNLYKKMLLAKSFPAQKVIVTSEPSLTSRVVSIIKCLSADPATHSILMIDHPGFQLVDAHNEYVNGVMLPVVTWTGGKPPYRFWVSYRPLGLAASDDVLGTKIVNLAPEFLKATIGPDIYTMEGIITKNADYWDDGWWADDGNGDHPQDEIGIVIEDSSDVPMQIFVPFTPLETDPNYKKYTGTGHSYGPDTWCPCPFEYTISSEITYGDDITFFSAPKGRIPGTETEVAGTYGVYLDAGCTQAATLTNPNAGTYLLFIQFIPNDTTHLRANVKEQTIVVNKVAQEALSIEFRRYFSAYSPYVSSVGDIDGSNVFVYNTDSGNPITFWTEPVGAAVFSPNNIAATYSGIDENGIPRNDQYGTKYTWVASGTITFYAQQAESINYSASPVWSQEIFVSNKGAYLIHQMSGGGIGGGITETVNFYPDKHVCEGGGVGGGTTKTEQSKTHYCSGGGVGGGATVTALSKQNQVIYEIYFYDATVAGYPMVTESELATRSGIQKLYIVSTCSSLLLIDLQVSGGTGLNLGYPVINLSFTWGGVLYDYPHTVMYMEYAGGPDITVTANQAGNAYWNAAAEISTTISPPIKEVLTLVAIIGPLGFTETNHTARAEIILSGNEVFKSLRNGPLLCTITTSSSNFIVTGTRINNYSAWYQSTQADFYCAIGGSYSFTVSVVNNPYYADFHMTFNMVVPSAPSKIMNSVTGFPTYFIFNPAMSSPNSIGNIRLASMGNAINNYTTFDAVAGSAANKVRKVGGQDATFTLGSTPVYGGSYKYTYATVYMAAFNTGCTLRIQHPGNAQYFPFDATYDLTPNGAKIRIPPTEPPPPTGASWHITYYQCNAAVLFKRYDSFNTSNNIYGVWRIGAAINGSATINAYVTWGWNDLYYHPSHDGDFAADFLSLTATQFYTAFIAPTSYWGSGSISVLWQFHITQIEYYY